MDKASQWCTRPTKPNITGVELPGSSTLSGPQSMCTRYFHRLIQLLDFPDVNGPFGWNCGSELNHFCRVCDTRKKCIHRHHHQPLFSECFWELGHTRHTRLRGCSTKKKRVKKPEWIKLRRDLFYWATQLLKLNSSFVKAKGRMCFFLSQKLPRVQKKLTYINFQSFIIPEGGKWAVRVETE